MVALLAILLTAVFGSVAAFRLVDADEGIFLLNAKMVLHDGQMPYLDFFYPQMPLLPYVYAAWMKLFGVSWYAGRALTALFAVTLGLLMYHHVTATTGRRIFGLLATGLLASNTLALEWLTPVKTLSLGTLLVFASYAMAFTRSRRWRYFFSGLLAGLATDTRIYLGVIVLLLLLEIVRTERERPDRIMQLARFAVGFLIALLPVELFVLPDPIGFLFNVLGAHGIRSPFGYVGAFAQKSSTLGDALGIYPVHASHLQFALLLILATAGILATWSARQRLPLCASITLLFLLVSLIPTPSYTQYFSVVVPFLIVCVVRFVADLAAQLPASGPTAPARRPLRALLAMTLLLYLLPAPFDVYRYTVAGDAVPGVFSKTNAPNWTIPAIQRVSRAIDATIPTPGAVTLTWWPGYLVESHAASLPKLENPYALWMSVRLTPDQLFRYHFISFAEVEWHITHHTAPVAVAGNWMFGSKPRYRDLLLNSGYVLTHRDGEAEIYVWRGAS